MYTVCVGGQPFSPKGGYEESYYAFRRTIIYKYDLREIMENGQNVKKLLLLKTDQ